VQDYEQTTRLMMLGELLECGGRGARRWSGVTGFPVSGYGTAGWGTFFVRLGAPDGDAAPVALGDAIRTAKARWPLANEGASRCAGGSLRAR
jgi:hypothetical protein